jgi:pyruvate dehydrogenase E1 component beta subunit
VIIRLPVARFRGHGPQGNEVGVSWFYNVPDLNIAMPGSANEAYWSFREALNRRTPTLFFEDRSIHNRSNEIAAENPAGKAMVIQSGERLTIVAAGRTAALAEDAAKELLVQTGPNAVEVVSLGFIKPLDHETILQSAGKTGRVLIVQDEPPYGGYALYVRSLLDNLPRGRLKVAPKILHGAENFLPFYDETHFLPSLANVIATAKELMQTT